MTKLQRRNKAARASRKRSKGNAAAKLLRAMGIRGHKEARVKRNRGGSVTVYPIKNRKRR